MANVILTEDDRLVIQDALNQVDVMLQTLERLAMMGRPIRRDDITFPQVRTAVNAAKAVTFQREPATTARRKK